MQKKMDGMLHASNLNGIKCENIEKYPENIKKLPRISG